MIPSVLKLYNNHPFLQTATESLCKKKRISVHGLGGSSLSFFAAAILSDKELVSQKRLLAVFPTEEEALQG